MGKPLDAIFCIAALVLTLYRGSAVAFVTLYLPSLLLLNTTQKINLPGLPDMNCTVAVLYGVLGALVSKAGRRFPSSGDGPIRSCACSRLARASPGW